MPVRDVETYQVVRLHDGRRLSFVQYGDPGGFAVLNAHGGLACRLDVAGAASIAGPCGIRLISPDRPGVGHSDPQPGRTILDWTRDVTELLDHLEVDRCAVMGWSLGGQYAAAVGYALPRRVHRVAVIAGAVPLTEPGEFDRLPVIDRTYIRMSHRAPWAARVCFRGTAFAAKHAPRLYGRFAASELGPADGAVVMDDGGTAFARMTEEALRQPQGVVEEYRVMVRPWGFEPEDIGVPVDVWAGTDDQLLDRAWPGELARRIPSATLHMRAGGHFLAHLYYRDIFESLRR
jgi:pimeloyl-ACP methyl ester carboxylesterase